VRILRWFDQWHWVWIALAAPFLIFPTVARSFAMLIIPGVWMIGVLARREPLRRTPLNPALLLLAVMVLVSLYATYDFAQSFLRLTTMVLEFGVYFAIVRSSTTNKGWWIALGLFLAAGVGVATLGLFSATTASKFQFLTFLIAPVPLIRTSLLGSDQSVNPNLVAGTLLWILPILCVLSLRVTRRFQVIRHAIGNIPGLVMLIIVWVITVFVGLVFILMQSRSGYLGLGILGTVLFVWLTMRRRIALGVFLLTLSVVGLGVFAFLVMGQGYASITWDSGSSVQTLEQRIEIWSRALYGIQDFPFTGMGMDTFRRVVHVLYPLFTVGPEIETIHAHNEYFQAALDLGIPGLIAFISLYLGSFTMLGICWRASLHDNPNLVHPILDNLDRAIILGLGGGLFAHMIYGLTDATIFIARYDIVFWILLGLIAGLYEQAQSRERYARMLAPLPPETLE